MVGDTFEGGSLLVELDVVDHVLEVGFWGGEAVSQVNFDAEVTWHGAVAYGNGANWDGRAEIVRRHTIRPSSLRRTLNGICFNFVINQFTGGI